MKKLAKALAVFTLIVLIAFGYYLYSSKLLTEYSVTVMPAVLMDDAFDEIKKDIEDGVYEGVSPLSSIDDYVFVTVDVKVKSISPFPAEWVTFGVNRLDGDAVIRSETAGPEDIKAFGESSYSVTLLTSDKTPYRTSILNYYILGHNRSVYMDNTPEETK